MRFLVALVGALLLLGACTKDTETPASTSIADPTSTPTSVEDPPTSEIQPTTSSPTPEDEPTTSTESKTIAVGSTLTGDGTLTATVVQVIPHDFEAQTQGLAWEGPNLIESTGVYGSSERRYLSPTAAQTSREKLLAAELFATDITLVGDIGIQLTGQEGIATTFNVVNLNEVGQIRYEGQGWGLCLEGGTLVMSDNTEILVRRNPESLAIVSPQPSPADLANLRALECAKDWIWAVVGDTNTVAVINVETGDLSGLVDLGDLLPGTAGPSDVLSAIAYNPSAETFYVAGRRWGVFYEIEIDFPS
jgi:glutamine cyclotransferase